MFVGFPEHNQMCGFFSGSKVIWPIEKCRTTKQSENNFTQRFLHLKNMAKIFDIKPGLAYRTVEVLPDQGGPELMPGLYFVLPGSRSHDTMGQRRSVTHTSHTAQHISKSIVSCSMAPKQFHKT